MTDERAAARSSAAEQIDRWETALADLLAALWERQEGVVMARLQGTKARKGTRHWTPTAAQGPVELKALDPSYVLDPVRWVMEAANTVRGLVTRMVGEVFGRMLTRLGVPDAAEPVPDEVLAAHADVWVARVVDGVQTANGEVQEAIRDADARGARMTDIASEVRELFQARRPVWAQRITTTCVVGAINAVSFDAARAAGCTSKQWLSTDDRKTRDTHIVADGQIVGILDRFRLGGYDDLPASTVLFPGDPTGLAQEIINCRCTMLFPLPDSPTGEVLQWKGYNPWQPRHPMGSGRGGQWADQDGPSAGAQAPLFQAPGQSVGTAPARSKPTGPAPRGLAAYGTGAKPRGRVIVRDVGPGQAPRSPSGNFVVGGTSRSSGGPAPGSLKNPAGLTRPAASSAPAPRAWSGFPTARGDEGAPGPSGDFDADVARIERLQSRYLRAGQETTALYAPKSGRRRWSRDRERQHEEIVDHFVNAPGVKADGRALLLGGLPGAGKTTSLNDPTVQALIDVDLSEYVTANSDEVKAEMIRRGMVPDYPGLTPLESATLYQRESHEVFQRVLDRAFSQRKNVAVDMTLRNPGHWDVTRSQMRAGEPPKYERTLLFVDVPVDTALARAQSRYEAGDRYVPAGFISGLRGQGGKTAPREVFDRVKHRADRWLLVDNSGTGPQLVADGGRF